MSSFKSLRGAFIRRCRSVVLGMSIRVKLLGLILTLVLALGHAITFQARHAVEKTLRSHLAVEGSSIAQNVAARATDLILVNDLFTLKELLKDIRGGCENIRYIFILDPYGYILAHTFGEGFPVPLINANEPTAAGFDRTVKLKTTEGLIWDTAVPISNGRVGVARVGISDADHRRDITHLTLRLITTTSVVAFIAILSSSFLVWFITRPIRSLAAAAEAVGRGDFSHRTGIRTRDELGALSKTFDQMTAELAKVRAERLAWERLHKQLLERVIRAQEEERKRIARELHDETSQSLTSLMVGLQRIQQLHPTPEIQAQMEELRSIAVSTLDNLHNLAQELRPCVLDELGLVAALEKYVNEYRKRYMLEVDCVTRGIDDQQSLPSVIATAIYRIVQEGLTNVARHANAASVSVLLEKTKDRTRIFIEDDGCGFMPEQIDGSGDHLGLFGIKERAELFGGRFIVESRPGAGTCLRVEIPIDMIPLGRITWNPNEFKGDKTPEV